MAKSGKRYREAFEAVDRSKSYELREAVLLLKGLRKPRFDETVEVALKLGIDPKQSDQMVRGSVSLPKGIGKDVRVVVFADGEKAEAAKAAGAVEVGAEDLAKKVEDGWMDFDVAIAVPAMMRVVGRLGRILGPQGKMPSPKSGTVTDDVADAVTEFRAGKIEYRSDSGGNVHAPVGKVSFSEDDLEQNIRTFVEHMQSIRPAGVKGTYLQKVCISSTMGPGIKVAM